MTLPPSIANIPASARALTSVGDHTTDALTRLFGASQGSLFPPEDDPDFFELAEAIRKRKWTDADAARLIDTYAEQLRSGRTLDVRTIARWVLAHQSGGPADPVLECITLDPPEEIDVIRVLSRRGSQKIVFLATWRLNLREVVLKKVIGPASRAAKVLTRELHPHPLNLTHPNIIETHVLRNARGQSFLVEQRLNVVLHDGWMAGGHHEAANLLVHIARALQHLHNNDLVHGDVKPDNIGRKGDSYILLDFGICRNLADFAVDTTPTGSLRTRAPELLRSDRPTRPELCDVWALGATTFNALTGRFPLIAANERVPPLTSATERDAFEVQLARRAEHEWARWVDISSIAEPLRGLLGDMLQADPAVRLTAAEVVRRADNELAAFLRPSATAPGGRFSPYQEFEQIRALMNNDISRRLLPLNKRQQIAGRLNEIRSLSGLGTADPEIQRMLAHLA